MRKKIDCDIMYDIKKRGQDFWNANPCGGNWYSYKEKMEWILKVESYIYDLLTDEVLNNKLVLEVGCGQGITTILSSSKCANIVGLDISKKSLHEARRGINELEVSNALLINADAESLPFPDNCFDIVYSLGVLHHTPDTQKSINEIHRVLKPGGKTIVMLYKAYNPKWLGVISFRFISNIVDELKKEDFYIANRLRIKYQKEENSTHGTALLELFGCPTLKMYSKTQVIRMFSQFRGINIKCYQSGFSRLFDFLPKILTGSFLHRLFIFFDSITANIFGFYIVVTAEK